jgi:hypothetical protein
MSANLYNTKISETYKTVLHFSDPLTAGDTSQIVYDGQGIATSLSVGASGQGLTVTGDTNIVGSLSVTGNLVLDGLITLSGSTNVNDVIFLSSGSSTSLEVPYQMKTGTLRLEDSSNNFRVIFGNSLSATSELWVIETNSLDNNLYIKRSLTDSNPPLVINRSSGLVTVNTLSVVANQGVVSNSQFTGTNLQLSTIGFQVLPSGLIMEWGTDTTSIAETTRTVSFPKTFGTACLNVVVTGRNTSAVNNIGCYPQIVSFNLSSFTYYNQGESTTTNNGITWQAFGY